MRRISNPTTMFMVAFTAAGLTSCRDTPDPAAPEVEAAYALGGIVNPADLISTNVEGMSRTLWPWTGAGPVTGLPSDPINLIFVGNSDPTNIRALLRSLPALPPFNCAWNDGIGGMQVTYAEPGGWAGGAVQLTCGEYESLRLHVRLFDVGWATLGAAHIEVIITGTSAHQVLSWEVPEQYLVGLLTGTGMGAVIPGEGAGINDSPWREIPPEIYNQLPVELRALAGGPLGDVGAPVPILSDGNATVIEVLAAAPPDRSVETRRFTIDFDQVIPKPFCNSSVPLVLVTGPVNLRLHVVQTPSGNYVSQFHAVGMLELTPLAGDLTPLGPSYRAHVNERGTGMITGENARVSSLQFQIEIPPQGPDRGRLMVKMRVGPDGVVSYSLDPVACGS